MLDTYSEKKFMVHVKEERAQHLAGPSDKAVMEGEKMIRIKQEKVEMAQQIKVKREMFEERPPPQAMSKFNAYSLPSSRLYSLPQAQVPRPQTCRASCNLHNQVMQATSHMQQMDMQGIQQLH